MEMSFCSETWRVQNVCSDNIKPQLIVYHPVFALLIHITHVVQSWVQYRRIAQLLDGEVVHSGAASKPPSTRSDESQVGLLFFYSSVKFKPWNGDVAYLIPTSCLLCAAPSRLQKALIHTSYV